MPGRSDPVGLVEAAYRPADGPAQWLEGFALRARPMFGGEATVVYTVRASPEGRVVIEHLAAVGSETGPTPEELRGDIEQVLAATPAGAFALLTRGGPVVSMAQLYAHIQPGGFVGPRLSRYQFPDAMAVVAAQPGPAAVVLASGLKHELRVTESLRRRWGRITAHVAAGQRLVRASGPVGLEPGPDDAVLEANARVAHAHGAAQSAMARERLRAAARAMDRARGPARRDPDEALALWQALVLGRWSLVERFDGDGRRYIIARKNEPWVTDPRRLSLREKQVIGFAAVGHSDKLIGYSLGLSASTVATHLANALTKLRLKSRLELTLFERPSGNAASTLAAAETPG